MKNKIKYTCSSMCSGLENKDLLYLYLSIVDHKKERMDQSWDKGSRVNC
jgi:hypothetical protein